MFDPRRGGAGTPPPVTWWWSSRDPLLDVHTAIEVVTLRLRRTGRAPAVRLPEVPPQCPPHAVIRETQLIDPAFQKPRVSTRAGIRIAPRTISRQIAESTRVGSGAAPRLASEQVEHA